jgi:iron complex outermembrane receptor protein
MNHSYQHSKDTESGHRTENSPSQASYFRVEWLKDNIRLSGQLNQIGERTRAKGDTRGRLKGYTTFDLTFEQMLPKNDISLKWSVKNLFNNDVREPSEGPVSYNLDDYNVGERSLYLEASLKF